MKIVKTAQAQEDLISIWAFVAAEAPTAADRLLDQIDAKLRLLMAFPEMGSSRPDLDKDFRMLVSGEHLILYRVFPEEIEIVRVVHGRRDLHTLARE